MDRLYRVVISAFVFVLGITVLQFEPAALLLRAGFATTLCVLA